jgi:preprotein translocase subunit YajC
VSSVNVWASPVLSGVLPDAGSGSNGSSGGSYGFLIVLALLAVAFYMFILRPQRMRQRKAQQQQRELSVGAKVMTASGMYATVAAIEDDAVLLEVAPGVTTRWARGAVGRVVETEEALGLETIDEDSDTPPPNREDRND